MDIIRYENLPVPPLASWRRDSAAKPSRHWAKVSADVDVKCVTLLIAPYGMYLPTSEGVELSAFYVASNALYAVAGRNVVPLPIKRLLAGFGIGEYGRSGLISIPGIGTHFAAEVIPCGDAPDPKWEWSEERPLSGQCAGCRACVEACPKGALAGDGRVDVDLCLRAQAQYQSPRMPDKSRDMLGASMWGCDICQEACPRNVRGVPVPMPEELERALELRRLLRGDVTALGAWIGTNYARPARMQARACLVAANLGRRDLAAEIGALLKSPVEPVRDCAAWALNKLENGGK